MELQIIKFIQPKIISSELPHFHPITTVFASFLLNLFAVFLYTIKFLPDKYLTLAIRYKPSSNPGTLFVKGSNTAAQRLRSGGGGWPGLWAWQQFEPQSKTLKGLKVTVF